MGITFKENCPDIRNTKVIPLINSLYESNLNIEVFDPWINSSKIDSLSNINFIESPKGRKYDAVIVAVAHEEFKKISKEEFISMKNEKGVIFDLKNILPKEISDLRL